MVPSMAPYLGEAIDGTFCGYDQYQAHSGHGSQTNANISCGAAVVPVVPSAAVRFLGKYAPGLASLFRTAPGVTSGATNAADYARLLDDLDFRQAASIFDEAGGLKPSVISNSRPIIPGDQLGNRQVVNALTSDGSNIADWAKYSTSTVQGPSGPFQAHFYYNSTTGVANYSIDYKVVFNNGVGG